jgi:hypothetical protein
MNLRRRRVLLHQRWCSMDAGGLVGDTREIGLPEEGFFSDGVSNLSGQALREVER